MLTYTISLPRKTPWEALRAEQLITQLLVTFNTLIFRIVAAPKAMKWQIIDFDQREKEVVMTAIRASYPSAQIEAEELDTSRVMSERVHRWVCNYRYRSLIFPAPMMYVEDIETPDPLATLTQAMSSLQEGEQIIYTLAVMGFAPNAVKQGQELITVPDNSDSVMGFFGSRKERYVHHLQVAAEEKLKMNMYHCLMFIQWDTPHGLERLRHLGEIDTQLVHYTRPEMGGIANYEGYSSLEIEAGSSEFDSSAIGIYQAILQRENEIAQIRNGRDVWKHIAVFLLPFLDEPDQFGPGVQMKLVSKEIAALWHLPHAGFSASTVQWQHSTQVEVPHAMKGQREGACLGINHYFGHEEPVHITNQDRATHMTIIGKTGTGKSTLLHHLIHQDISHNRGVAVIDPHGDLVRMILQTSIPKEREGDVIILDLANEAYPPPLNLLAVPQYTEPMTTAGQVVSLIERISGRLGETPRVADTLTMALVTLWQEDKPTLLDIDRLFDTPAYRNDLVRKTNNIAVRRFWEKFDLQSPAQQEQLTYPVIYRLRSFYGNPTLLPMMCHPDTLDFGSLIEQRKIILVSLAADDKKIPPREQALFGATIVSALQTSLGSGETPSQFFSLYLDEAQRFVTTSLPELFETARKRGLALVLANQYLKQLAGDTLEAVMGNVGAIVAFQCGHDDARILSPYIKPGFDAEDLVRLDKYQTAVWMRHQGQTQPAFSLSTLPPMTLDNQAEALQREQYIRQLSVQHYTPKSRADVMQWIDKRYSPPPQSSNDELYDPLQSRDD